MTVYPWKLKYDMSLVCYYKQDVKYMLSNYRLLTRYTSYIATLICSTK